jgi:CRISPR-associated protein (TIGR03984 family)
MTDHDTACPVSTGWALLYRNDRADLTRLDTDHPLDPADAWHIRVFDGRREARWWADTGHWDTVEVPDDGLPVRYRLWGGNTTIPAGGGPVTLVDRQVGTLAVWVDSPAGGSGPVVLDACEVIATDEYGNRHVTDEVLVRVVVMEIPE